MIGNGRGYEDRYACLAMKSFPGLSSRIDRFAVAGVLWRLADYLESVDDGKHEQHLLMLGAKWIKKEMAMAKENYGEGQLKSQDSAPDFARETGMPKDRQLSQDQAPNTLDPSGGGNQKGDGAKE